MCIGSQPQAPQVVYQGPSEDDIRRNEESLANYQQQISDQQTAFQAQLQQQIDDANASTAALQTQYDADLQAASQAGQAQIAAAETAGAAETAAASSAAQRQAVNALTVTTQQTEAAMPETTTASTKKKDQKPKSLKISTAGVSNAVGSGVNLGI